MWEPEKVLQLMACLPERHRARSSLAAFGAKAPPPQTSRAAKGFIGNVPTMIIRSADDRCNPCDVHYCLAGEISPVAYARTQCAGPLMQRPQCRQKSVTSS